MNHLYSSSCIVISSGKHSCDACPQRNVVGHNNGCVRLIKTLMSYTDEVMALISSVAAQMMKGSDEYGRKSVMSMPSRSQSPCGLEDEH